MFRTHTNSLRKYHRRDLRSTEQTKPDDRRFKESALAQYDTTGPRFCMIRQIGNNNLPAQRARSYLSNCKRHVKNPGRNNKQMVPHNRPLSVCSRRDAVPCVQRPHRSSSSILKHSAQTACGLFSPYGLAIFMLPFKASHQPLLYEEAIYGAREKFRFVYTGKGSPEEKV